MESFFIVDTQGDSSLLELELPPCNSSSPEANDDFISLNVKNSKKRNGLGNKQKKDIYQDYIDNMDNVDKNELDGETDSLRGYYDALSLLNSQECDSDESSASTSVLKEISKDFSSINEPQGLSKSQKKKLRKDEKNSKKQSLEAESLERYSASAALASALKKSQNKLTNPIIKLLERENQKIAEFVSDKEQDRASLILPPMPAALRKIMSEVAEQYQLTFKVRGKGKDKTAIVFRTLSCRVPDNYAMLIREIAKKYTSVNIYSSWNGPSKSKSTKGSLGGPNDLDMPKVGDIVGSNAEPIQETNLGHKMLLAMGWKPGEGLGEGGSGVKTPLPVTVRSRRSGLGTGI